MAAPSLLPKNDCVQSRLLKDTLLTSGDGRPPEEPFVKKDGLKTNAFIRGRSRDVSSSFFVNQAREMTHRDRVLASQDVSLRCVVGAQCPRLAAKLLLLIRRACVRVQREEERVDS